MKRAILGVLLLGSLSLTGCGGGQSGVVAQSAAGVTMHVEWVPLTRVVPGAARSVQIVATDSAGFVITRTLNRPTSGNLSTAVFLGMAPGVITLQSRAFAQSDAQGVLVGTASQQALVGPGASGNVNLTLASTISRLEITPNPVSVRSGVEVTLTVNGKDSDGNVVPLTPSALRWTTANDAVAAVDNSGKVTGGAVGTTQVTCTDTESNRSLTVNVTVTSSTPIN
jgi:hypothetical protein